MAKVIDLYNYKKIKYYYGNYLMNNNYMTIFNDNINNIRRYNICDINLLMRNKKVIRVLLYNYVGKFIYIESLIYEYNIYDEKYEKIMENFIKPETDEEIEFFENVLNISGIKKMLEKKQRKNNEKFNRLFNNIKIKIKDKFKKKNIKPIKTPENIDFVEKLYFKYKNEHCYFDNKYEEILSNLSQKKYFIELINEHNTIEEFFIVRKKNRNNLKAESRKIVQIEKQKMKKRRKEEKKVEKRKKKYELEYIKNKEIEEKRRAEDKRIYNEKREKEKLIELEYEKERLIIIEKIKQDEIKEKERLQSIEKENEEKRKDKIVIPFRILSLQDKKDYALKFQTDKKKYDCKLVSQSFFYSATIEDYFDITNNSYSIIISDVSSMKYSTDVVDDVASQNNIFYFLKTALFLTTKNIKFPNIQELLKLKKCILEHMNIDEIILFFKNVKK